MFIFGNALNATKATSGYRSSPAGISGKALAFAQLTGRRSLRDIETSLEAQRHKLYWVSVRRLRAIRSPMLTRTATGVSTKTLLMV